MIIFLQHKEMCVKQLCIINTTLNVLRCSTIYFSTIQLYICFKMFMTCTMCYVILTQMKKK